MRIEDKMEVQNMIDESVEDTIKPLIFIGLLVLSAGVGLFVGWLWWG